MFSQHLCLLHLPIRVADRSTSTRTYTSRTAQHIITYGQRDGGCPSQETHKVSLDAALSNLICRSPCSMQESWTTSPSKVPSNSKDSEIPLQLRLPFCFNLMGLFLGLWARAHPYSSSSLNFTCYVLPHLSYGDSSLNGDWLQTFCSVNPGTKHPKASCSYIAYAGGWRVTLLTANFELCHIKVQVSTLCPCCPYLHSLTLMAVIQRKEGKPGFRNVNFVQS